jgi:hypothetical protein
MAFDFIVSASQAMIVSNSREPERLKPYGKA